jgi:hypothetical protein
MTSPMNFPYVGSAKVFAALRQNTFARSPK